MAALTSERDTPARGSGIVLPYPVGAGKLIFAGALVVLAGGYAEPGTAAPGRKAVGRANRTADNRGGASGDATVEVQRGVLLFAQDGTLSHADVGHTCYVVDDQTVAKTDGGGTRSPAGTLRGIEPAGVWVEIA